MNLFEQPALAANQPTGLGPNLFTHTGALA